jgi:1,2-diacylglycerol 3-beta-glucosyltransferase
MMVLELCLLTLGVYLSAHVLYQLVLFFANALVRDKQDFEPARVRTFNVVLPAHNEELYLPRLLRSLDLQQYPKERYRVSVVADNCTDGTVPVCGPFDVDLFERTTAGQKGKGHAIRWCLEQIGVDRFDAFVIVDGDSIVAPDFLHQLNLQMERGDQVIQCYNGVANPEQSWFTRLMNVSRTIANEIIHPGKRKLGLSSHLMGNGMCFDARVLASQGWKAFSIAEDWEYYARLILSGMDVGYSKYARVYHQESLNLRQASPQRMRWSGGRFAVLRQYGPRLVLKGLREGRWMYIDAALPLVLPNPSLGINLTFVGLALCGASYLLWGRSVPLVWYASLALLQFFMFMVGVLYTRNKVASAASLALAPVFLAWKMGIDILSMCTGARKEWKPTERRLS